MRVVIADDDLAQRTYLTALLRRLGHETFSAADGPTALDLLQVEAATLLLCDVEMPGMDGFDLVRQVRALPLDRYVYILMITSRQGENEQMAGLESGADDFMSKPVKGPVLTARLRSAERLLHYEAELQARNRRLEEAQRTIRDDLAAASRAQRQLLPQASERIASCRFESVFVPSADVSGDVFGYFSLGAGLVGFFAADVSGHGVRAALSAVALGHMITAEFFTETVIGNAAGGPLEIRPERLAEVLDRRFASTLADDSYFALLVGVIEEATNRLHICQAGFPPPLLLRPGAAAVEIGEGGPPVALVPHAQFERTIVDLRGGDRLLVYSDGVVEAASPAGEHFGNDRLAALATSQPGNAPAALLGNLTDALKGWAGSARFDDDISVIVIDREN